MPYYTSATALVEASAPDGQGYVPVTDVQALRPALEKCLAEYNESQTPMPLVRLVWGVSSARGRAHPLARHAADLAPTHAARPRSCLERRPSTCCASRAPWIAPEATLFSSGSAAQVGRGLTY